MPVAAAAGLARLIQALALVAELPAVIAAADTVLLDPPVQLCSPAMGAARVKQSRLAARVAEEDHVLTEPPDRFGRVTVSQDQAITVNNGGR